MSKLRVVVDMLQGNEVRIIMGVVILILVSIIILFGFQKKQICQTRQISQQITDISKQLKREKKFTEEKEKHENEIKQELSEAEVMKNRIQREKEEDLFGSVMEEIFS